MAGAKLISNKWSDEVKLFLEATTEGGVPDDRGNVRLSKALRVAKPEAYIPQMVSLGPYHHSSLKDESVGPFHKRLTHLSQMEMYKLRSAREAAGKGPEIIEKMFLEVSHQDTISELEKFYDWEVLKQEKDDSNFAWMMMVDALFLSYFLKSASFDDDGVGRGASEEIVIPAKASIRCDVVKLENQIPLSLVKKLEEIVPETSRLDSLLPSQMESLSSFQVFDIKVPSFNEKHLLGCIHKYVSTFLQVSREEQDCPLTCYQKMSKLIGGMLAVVLSCCYTHPAKRGRRDFLDKYSAKELAKAGIKFKSLIKKQDKIRFCRNSHTLFLPKIIVSETYTEVLLRNLLALEFNESGRERHVSNYVALMNCLIDTPEDVRLLRKSHVIDRESMMITDKYVAKMWDGLSKPFSLAGFLELPRDLKPKIKDVLIKNYYKTKIKAQLSKLYRSRPGRFFRTAVDCIPLCS